MNKLQFLEILGQKLAEELPRNRVISNLQYYESYIDGAVSAGKSEQEVLEELGDPYMIAHTILDTETGEAFYEQQFAEDAEYTQTETIFEEENGTYKTESFEERAADAEQPEVHVHHIKTNHGCLILALILILVVVVVVTIIGKVINILWPILAPVLLILLIVSIFSDRRR